MRSGFTAATAFALETSAVSTDVGELQPGVANTDRSATANANRAVSARIAPGFFGDDDAEGGVEISSSQFIELGFL